MGTPGDPFDDQMGSMAPDAPDNDNFEVDLEESDVGPTAGWYYAAVKDIRKGEGKESGVPMFIWDITLIKNAQGDETHQGWEDSIFTSKSSKAQWKMEETLFAVGAMSQEQLGKDLKIGFKRGDVVGKAVMALVEETEFNNRKRMQITQLMPPSEGAGTQADIPGGASDDIPF